MAVQDDATLELEQQVLPDRLDREQTLAVQPFGQSVHRSTRVRGLDLEALADERLEPAGRAVKCVTLRHRVTRISGVDRRAAAAGAAAAVAWGLVERLDMAALRCDYSDIALLGKGATRGPRWRTVGFLIHSANGAVFGLVWAALNRRRPTSPVAFALAEHAALWPLGRLVDRYHPARGTAGVTRLTGNRVAYAQATWRHAFFGWLLGRLYR
jgi:hypothetical protein